MGSATKNLGDFWSHGPCFRSGFPLGGGEHRSGEPNSFRIYRLAVSVPGDICAPPSRRVDSSRKIDEAERSGWMRGPLDPKSLKISINFSLRLSARRLGIDPGWRSKIFQNLLGWPFLVLQRPFLSPRQIL